MTPPTGRSNRSRGGEPLGPLQSAVMEGLWQRQSATAAEITSSLNALRPEPLSTKTILTCLTRLEEKGLVCHHKDSRAYRFIPTKSREEVAAWYLLKQFDAIIERFGDLAVAIFVQQVAADPDRFHLLRQMVEVNDARGGP